MDLGHYERFTTVHLSRENNCTTGRIYDSVIQKGTKRVSTLGGTVQVVPHITDEIKQRRFSSVSHDVDVVIVEIGGTVGDIESPSLPGGHSANAI